MSIILEFVAPASSFLLAETLRADPEMTVEIERVAGHPDTRVSPYFWVVQYDREAFETAVRADPSVDDVEVIDEHDDAALYRSEWSRPAGSLFGVLFEVDVALLEAVGRDDEWHLRLRFDDRDALAEFDAYRRDLDLGGSVVRFFHPDEPKRGTHHGLTTAQHETLVAALDAGYYEVPGRVTHDELAAQLGISQQAVSTRLRRAHGNLVRANLVVGESNPDATDEP